MHAREGTRQRALHRITCEWGRWVTRHAVVCAVFQPDYKVRGLIGFNLGDRPVWYPGVPITVSGKHLVFNPGFDQAGPPPADEWPGGLLDGAYICDPWQVVAPAIATARAAGGREALGRWRDVFEARIPAGTIEDIIYEHTLHRLRGIIVRRGWFRRKTYSLLEIPPLAESLKIDYAAESVGAQETAPESP